MVVVTTKTTSYNGSYDEKKVCLGQVYHLKNLRN